MRTDILDLHEFYATPLGSVAREAIANKIHATWDKNERCRIAGFGYTNPYLGNFIGAERVFSFSPDAQGVMRWPVGPANAREKCRAALVSEIQWPLPSNSIDRLLIIHGLEETGEPRQLMREAWRVLADDGRMVIVAAHRRGFWSTVEATPFAAGRPYLRRQLDQLLRESMFRAVGWRSALHFPPMRMKAVIRLAPAWERTGNRLWPGLGGVIVVEAEKDMAAPKGLVQRASVRSLRPAIAARPAAVGASRDTSQTPS